MNTAAKISAIFFAVVLTLGMSGCQEQEKAAEERGKKPQKILKNAQDKVNAAVSQTQDRLNQGDE